MQTCVACNIALHAISIMDSRLRAFRHQRKLTLGVMAKQLGITPGQLSRIEREGTTSFPRAIALADMTGLPVGAFAPNGLSVDEAA